MVIMADLRMPPPHRLRTRNRGFGTSMKTSWPRRMVRCSDHTDYVRIESTAQDMVARDAERIFRGASPGRAVLCGTRSMESCSKSGS